MLGGCFIVLYSQIIMLLRIVSWLPPLLFGESIIMFCGYFNMLGK